MINLHISDDNFTSDDKINEYVSDKIGALDKYLPKSAKNGQGKVILIEDVSGREDNKYVCEALLSIPGNDLVAREAAINMYTSVDIVTAKLKAQAVKYKQKNERKPSRAKLIIRKIFRYEEQA